MAAIRIGTNPIAWSNDDMRELGGATPLEQCLAEAHEAGYSGIELGHKFPREAGSLKPILAKHQLALVSGWYSTNLRERSLEAEIAAMAPHQALLQAMGCKIAITAETSGAVHGDVNIPLSRRPHLQESEWQPFCDKMTALAVHLQKQGLSLAYHHHMGTVIETEAELDRFMKMTGDSVKLLLDTGHLTFAGGDPLKAAQRYAARIAHVHTKDVRSSVLTEAKAKDWSFLKAVVAGIFTVPGDGMVNYPSILAELKRTGYSGWLVVEAEQDPEKANPLTYAKLGYRNLQAFAKAAGFQVASHG